MCFVQSTAAAWWRSSGHEWGPERRPRHPVSIVLPNGSDEGLQLFYPEAIVWRQLQHDNVLQFIGIDRHAFPGAMCLVSPWMTNGTVIDYLRKTDASADPPPSLRPRLARLLPF